MAEERAAAVETWIRERSADARTVAAYPTVVYLAAGRQGPPYPFPRGAGAESHVVQLLRMVAAHNGYEAVWVMGAGPRASILARTTDAAAPADAAQTACDRAADFVDFRRVEDNLRMVLATPIWPGEARVGRPVGAVVLTEDPTLAMFRPLSREPVPSRTGETVIVRREGRDILFLSPLRHAAAPLGTLRLPPAKAGDRAAAAVALTGNRAFGTFTDYRGTSVLAAVAPLREVPDSALVVKIDRDEALEAHRAETQATAAAMGGLLLAIAGVGFGLWRQQAALARLALARTEAGFAHIVEHAADAVLFMRLDGRIVRANSRAEGLYGYSRDEILTRRFQDFYPPESHAAVSLLLEEVRTRSELVFEAEHRDRDGSPFPVEVASRFLETEDGGAFVSIVRDARERKAAERRIAFLNRTLRTLSEIHQLMIREGDGERLLHEACRILVESGGFRMAWIGFKDSETEWLVPSAWAGHEDGFLSQTWFSGDESSPAGRGPAGEALRQASTEKRFSVGRSSADIPITRAPALRKSFAASLNACASSVQPLVKALGKK
jgi:PAS domain S-box-containing protein